MASTEDQLLTRDRMMRLVAGRMTPAERMRRMEAMQNAAWEILNRRP